MAGRAPSEDDTSAVSLTRLHAARPRAVADLEPAGRLRVTSAAAPEYIGQSFMLIGAPIIGRSHDAAICLQDEGISRQHAKVISSNGHYDLEDLGSRNGTFVNGAPIKRVRLSDGDHVQIGAVTVLRFVAHPTNEEDDSLRHALSAARIGIWEWSASSGAATWSEAVDRALSVAPGTLARRTLDLMSLVHPDDRIALHDSLTRTLSRGGTLECECRLVLSGDVERWVSFKGDPVRSAAPGADRIVGTVMNITERKRAEQELRRQALLFESLYDGVVLCDSAGRIVDWNASAERMFGHAKATVIGKKLFTAIRSEEADSETDAMLEAVTGQGRWTGEVELTAKDGRPFVCEAVVVPLKDPSGQVLGNIAIHRDVTERAQMQQKLLQADRLASLGTLAAGVAHEINNPLAFIKANLDFLMEDIKAKYGDQSEAFECLDESLDGVHRIAKIVRDLKAFSSSDAADQPAAVDVKSSLELALRMAGNTIRYRAQIVEQFEEGALVLGDASKLGQVFLNLLLNAAQAIPEGHAAENQIRLSVRSGKGETVEVEVADTGVGMSKEVQARIFDPFFTTKPIGVGTGLGLSISLGIVRACGGSISVVSAPGQGSTLTVTLRRAPSPSSTASPPTPQVVSSGRARILVIDDEHLVGVSLRRSLSGRHDVSVVERAADALVLLRQDSGFDVILCDLMMPEMTGMDLYRRVLEELPQVSDRFVFMTGGAFTEAATAFVNDVGHRSMAKPIEVRDVLALADRALVSG